jgi:hypothetical protein
MITSQEVSRGIFGAWMLARMDAKGVFLFDNTVEAFWRSFWAASVALPIYGILLVLRNSGASIGVAPGTAFLIHSITYVMGWIAFPFAMFYVARTFDRQQWYCRYIAAYNWAVVLQLSLMLLVSSIVATGVFSSSIGTFITIGTVLAILAYQGYIARVALQATIPGAVGIVLLDLILSLTLDGWSARLMKLQYVTSG